MFVSGFVHLKHLVRVLEEFFFDENCKELEERQWVRLACNCVAEAAQQRPSDVSLEKKLEFLKAASRAIIPSEVDVRSSRLSVVDAEMLSIHFTSFTSCHKVGRVMLWTKGRSL